MRWVHVATTVAKLQSYAMDDFCSETSVGGSPSTTRICHILAVQQHSVHLHARRQPSLAQAKVRLLRLDFGRTVLHVSD